jgi:predicted nuclease of predicted toxin-antitoxin system
LRRLAVHWSTVGSHKASDGEILDWAKAEKCVLFTHDLDFGAILAAAHEEAPSVIQLRTQDITPGHASNLLLKCIEKFSDDLERGALISLDEGRSRVRLLPLRPE